MIIFQEEIQGIWMGYIDMGAIYNIFDIRGSVFWIKMMQNCIILDEEVVKQIILGTNTINLCFVETYSFE
jgi:hypothetical protein